MREQARLIGRMDTAERRSDVLEREPTLTTTRWIIPMYILRASRLTDCRVKQQRTDMHVHPSFLHISSSFSTPRIYEEALRPKSRKLT